MCACDFNELKPIKIVERAYNPSSYQEGVLYEKQTWTLPDKRLCVLR